MMTPSALPSLFFGRVIGREKMRVFAFDCHTQKGRKMGKSKAEFFRDEQAALEPFQPRLFDDLIED